MSRQIARMARDQLTNRPALVAASYITSMQREVASGMSDDLRCLEECDPLAEIEAMALGRHALAAAYGYGPGSVQDKPFAFADGKAIIPIQGTLINRFPYSFGGYATGYNFIRSQITAAEADPDVNGVIFDVNSYGGMVSGCQETADMIADMEKPTLACVDANCMSAAYMLASQADKLVVTPSGQVGSVGVVQVHMDMSGMLDNIGIKPTLIYSGDHKVDGNPFEPLSKGVKADMQAGLDDIYSMFVSKVAQGRNIPEQAVRDTQAQVYDPQEALGLGLIDAVQTPSVAVNDFFDEDEDDDTNPTGPRYNRRTEAMTTSAAAAAPAITQSDVDSAAQAARTAERERIAGIQNHPEAVGRGKLASHIALSTSMSISEAASLLAASPKELPAAPAAAAGNPFQAAMANTQNPNVGAGDAEAAGGEREMAPAQRILSAHTKATGYRAPDARSN